MANMSSTHVSDPLRPLSLELRHFRLVLAIQELGGLTRASERLNLTQSALSHQLKEIEDRLGVQLFLRVRRKLVATEAGERLASQARQVLAQALAIEDDLLHRARDRRGTIRLTTECYTCYDWLPPLLKPFGKDYPDVRIQIVADATANAVDALLDGDVDLALATRPTHPDQVRARAMFDDELLLVTAADHPLASKPYVQPAHLASETVILYSPPSFSNFYSQFFGGGDVQPKEIVQIQLTEAMLSMISAGLGVGAFAKWAIQRQLKRGTLATVQLGPRGMHRTWYGLTRKNERVPQYVDDFIDLIAKKAAPGRFEQRCA
jgi:LysR family transcriptional regulator for metE and metH